MKKQKLYERVVKKHTPQNERKYKNDKNLLEAIKKNSKKMHYSNKYIKFIKDIKKRNILKNLK